MAGTMRCVCDSWFSKREHEQPIDGHTRTHSLVLETAQEDLSIYWIATEEVGAGTRI